MNQVLLSTKSPLRYENPLAPGKAISYVCAESSNAVAKCSSLLAGLGGRVVALEFRPPTVTLAPLPDDSGRRLRCARPANAKQ